MRRVLPIVIAIAFILVVGCGRKAVPFTATEVRDSIVFKETIRIVRDTIPGETVTVTEVIECDSTTNKPKPKSIKAKSGRAVIDINISKDGKLTGSGGCDSLIRELEARDRIIERFRSEKKEAAIPQPVYKTYWFDVPSRWISGFVLLYALFWIIRAFIKLKSLPI